MFGLKFFYWSGIVFWGLMAIGFLYGISFDIRRFIEGVREEDRARKDEKEKIMKASDTLYEAMIKDKISSGFGLEDTELDGYEMDISREEEANNETEKESNDKADGGEKMDYFAEVEELKMIENRVDNLRNQLKTDGKMTITLEGKFSDVLAELRRIRKTFENS